MVKRETRTQKTQTDSAKQKPKTTLSVTQHPAAQNEHKPGKRLTGTTLPDAAAAAAVVVALLLVGLMKPPVFDGAPAACDAPGRGGIYSSLSLSCSSGGVSTVIGCATLNVGVGPCAGFGLSVCWSLWAQIKHENAITLLDDAAYVLCYVRILQSSTLESLIGLGTNIFWCRKKSLEFFHNPIYLWAPRSSPNVIVTQPLRTNTSQIYISIFPPAPTRESRARSPNPLPAASVCVCAS